MCRLTGPAAFRHSLLQRQGKLILVPEAQLCSSVEELAAYIKRRIESLEGLSLDAYRQ